MKFQEFMDKEYSEKDDVFYEIPQELTKDKSKIEVRFSSGEGKIAGRVFDVRITTEQYNLIVE